MTKQKSTKFNPNSPKQLCKLLYEIFKLPILEHTEKGSPSTKEDTLLLLKDSITNQDAVQIIDMIIKTRGQKKLISTYYEGTVELIYPDGYVRPQFNHTATDTGRLSAKGPNLQNQPDNLVLEHFVSRYI